MPALTYLAHLKQISANFPQRHYKSGSLLIRHASIMPRFLLIQRRGKHGASHRGIVTIGIVQDVVWVAQSKSMVVWLKVVGHWLKTTVYFS
jgi:hypothetical protein